jgi:pimeloyl-ACP methyl ester carboxylesterase
MKKLIKGIKILLALVLVFILVIILLFGHRDIPLEELKSKYTNAASSFISVNGMNVHYRDEGNKTDTLPIVLIHGTGSSLHTFDTWTDRLKISNRVVRMDLPAYGLTGPFPDRNYSVKQYTAFLKDFLTALNIKQCVLVGNSLGGQIAWNFSLKLPDMVAKLILIDPAGYPLTSKSVPAAFKLAQIPVVKNLFTYVTPRFLARSSLENVYFDKSKITDSLVNRYFELTLRAGNRQAFVDRLNSTKDTSAYNRIGEINQPTLILWGENDLLIPVENAYKFHKDLPNDTLVILDKSGHVPMEETPYRSLAPVLNFLKNTEKLNSQNSP